MKKTNNESPGAFIGAVSSQRPGPDRSGHYAPPAQREGERK